MKWTFAILALLIIPASAFGANAWMWLQPGGSAPLDGPPVAPTPIVITPTTTTVAVDFYLKTDDKWSGFGMGLTADKFTTGSPYMSRISAVTRMPIVGTWNTTGIGADGLLKPTSKNLGIMGDPILVEDPETFETTMTDQFAAGTYKVLSMTLTLSEPAAFNNIPIAISIGNPGGGINVAAYEGANYYNNGNLPGTNLQGVVLIPEPASMLLLALGGLFLRRRHA